MKQELALVKGSVTPDPKASTTAARKELREATDRVIHDALLIDDLPGLVQLSAETMLAVATVLARYEQDPDVRDLVEAAQAHIEHGRAVMDKGLMLASWETVRCGAVMLELTVRGICAALSAPYDLVLAEVLRARQAGENPAIRRVLTEAGLLKEDPHEAANS
jgi:hypothetical protein